MGYKSAMKTTREGNTMTVGTSFSTGFKLRYPDGTVRSFPACQWHTDPAWKVLREGGGHVLVRLGSRDENFAEVGKEDIPPGTQATYWDDGDDAWFDIT